MIRDQHIIKRVKTIEDRSFTHLRGHWSNTMKKLITLNIRTCGNSFYYSKLTIKNWQRVLYNTPL